MRILLWAHFVYLLLLPTLAVVSALFMFPSGEIWEALLIAGFPPVVAYSLFLANGYRLPNSLPVALFVVLAAPLQIAASIFLWGSRSIWLFFAESAAVEIGAFVLGVMFVAIGNRRAEYSGASFSLLFGAAVLLFVGGVIPQLISVFYGYGGPSLWMVLFISAFIAAFLNYVKLYRKLSAAYSKKKVPQELEMVFDNTLAARLFNVPRDIELLSPTSALRYSEELANKLILLFGFTAMFLPVPVGTITALILGRV